MKGLEGTPGAIFKVGSVAAAARCPASLAEALCKVACAGQVHRCTPALHWARHGHRIQCKPCDPRSCPGPSAGAACHLASLLWLPCPNTGCTGWLQGSHRIEALLYRNGDVADAVPWAQQLAADYKSLVGKLENGAARFTPPCIWYGLVEVATEVAKKKVRSSSATLATSSKRAADGRATLRLRAGRPLASLACSVGRLACVLMSICSTFPT